MIDITKEYKTRSGKKVIGLKYNPYNSCNRKVTYPIKGTIIIKEKPLKMEYYIWSENGVSDIIWGNHKDKDLILA